MKIKAHFQLLEIDSIDQLNILKLTQPYRIPEGERQYPAYRETLSTGRMTHIVLSRHPCTVADVDTIAGLWNELPEIPHAEEGRCHEPGYALEIMLSGERILVAAICWHCNNISIEGRLATGNWRRFAADAPSGRALLVICQWQERNIVPVSSD